jgi:hypothetical protein
MTTIVNTTLVLIQLILIIVQNMEHVPHFVSIEVLSNMTKILTNIRLRPTSGPNMTTKIKYDSYSKPCCHICLILF